jgi:hypothetical protein
MTGSRIISAVGALGALLVTVAAAADVVERRGAAPAMEGEITIVDECGVTVRSPLGAAHVVPWDRVRRAESDLYQEAIDRYRETATDLWRARTRVERTDTTLAEPLLERLFERYRGQTHETALVVAEGLLRCRLARADHVLAVIPALETARLRRAGVTTKAYAALPAIYDDEYALVTVLPPVWVPSPLLASLAHELETYPTAPEVTEDAVVTALTGLYRIAVRQALGRADETPPAETLPEHPGVALLDELNQCSDADADRRRSARQRLSRLIPSLPPWAEAWARFCIGRCLVADDGIAAKQEGAVSLIYVPARFGRSQPFLAGLALAYASRALEEAGATGDAADLLAELGRSYPRHPLLSIGVTHLGPRPGAGAGPPEDDE